MLFLLLEEYICHDHTVLLLVITYTYLSWLTFAWDNTSVSCSCDKGKVKCIVSGLFWNFEELHGHVHGQRLVWIMLVPKLEWSEVLLHSYPIWSLSRSPMMGYLHWSDFGSSSYMFVVKLKKLEQSSSLKTNLIIVRNYSTRDVYGSDFRSSDSKRACE